ncbi:MULTISPECIES: lipoprotein HlpB [Glaesserella]|uniref:Lipoprotein HlpB n=1 Tax=Glaesserella australis TaxID=2094024 RepID=A0A328C0Z3_9PAST|nr:MULTISPECIES: lipoprotein HlpB [Glaesserella]AUI65391.1 lipoprotein HlpB [Glaesserella sp. 15-184]RAL19585.1 lipoprotein HlpB [Glaesserella australis]
MNKFTKISAAALLTLFLAACDKPAPAKPADAPKPEAAPAAPAPTAEAPKADVVQVQGIEDFKKLVDWNQSQEKALAGFQAELQQTLATQDKAKIEEALKAFTLKVGDVLKSLDSLDIKNADVAAFKAKTKETLELSNDLISESVKVMANPTEDAQKLIQEKSQKLMQSGADLQKLQLELQQKFGGK